MIASIQIPFLSMIHSIVTAGSLNSKICASGKYGQICFSEFGCSALIDNSENPINPLTLK